MDESYNSLYWIHISLSFKGAVEFKTEILYLKPDRPEILLWYVKLNFKMILLMDFFRNYRYFRIYMLIFAKIQVFGPNFKKIKLSQLWIFFYNFWTQSSLCNLKQTQARKFCNFTTLFFWQGISLIFPIFIILSPLKNFLSLIWKKIELGFIGNVLFFNLSHRNCNSDKNWLSWIVFSKGELWKIEGREKCSWTLSLFQKDPAA